MITPNFETIYESAFGTLFGTFSDWWDNSISDEFNPFTTIENEVLDQLKTVDTEIEDEMACDRRAAGSRAGHQAWLEGP